MILKIFIDKALADCALQGFPWSEDQWITSEIERDNTLEVTATLGGAGDVGVAQEIFLNTNPAVIGWDVVNE